VSGDMTGKGTSRE